MITKEKTDSKYLENKKGELIGLGQKNNQEIESPRQRDLNTFSGDFKSNWWTSFSSGTGLLLLRQTFEVYLTVYLICDPESGL